MIYGSVVTLCLLQTSSAFSNLNPYSESNPHHFQSSQTPFERDQSPFGFDQSPYSRNQSPYGNSQSPEQDETGKNPYENNPNSRYYRPDRNSLVPYQRQQNSYESQNNNQQQPQYKNPNSERAQIYRRSDVSYRNDDVTNGNDMERPITDQDGRFRSMNWKAAFENGPSVNYNSEQNSSPILRPPSEVAYSTTTSLLRNKAPLMNDGFPPTRQFERYADKVFASCPSVTVLGGALRTCSFDDTVDRVQICMKTNGGSLTANLELWEGIDVAPQRIGIYLEDGAENPFLTVLETPSYGHSVAIRNTGTESFPLNACVDLSKPERSSIPVNPCDEIMKRNSGKKVSGSSIYSASFGPEVERLQVVLNTDGRPLNARVEFYQGSEYCKQELEVYSVDGSSRPFFTVIETGGRKTGCMIRIVNTSPNDLALNAYIVSLESVTPNGSNILRPSLKSKNAASSSIVDDLKKNGATALEKYKGIIPPAIFLLGVNYVLAYLEIMW